MSALSTMTWPEVDAHLGAYTGGVLAVPLGSTEQHGPHLPLSTDTAVASALAAHLAAAVPEVVAAPALPYGSAGEHAPFPGTLSIGQDALQRVLMELVRSSSLRRTVFVNGHGGNGEPLRRAVTTLTADGHDVLAWFPQVPGGDAHAGHTETAIMLHLDKRAVRESACAAGNLAPLPDLLPALRAGRLRVVAPNGVLGDPTAATAREGADLLAALGADLVTAVRERWGTCHA